MDSNSETQLDRIERLVSERAYSWPGQISMTFECMTSAIIAKSGISAGPGHVAIILKDYDARQLRDWLIDVHGYPEKVLVKVGNPGPDAK